MLAASGVKINFCSSLETLAQDLGPWLTSKSHLWVIDAGCFNQRANEAWLDRHLLAPRRLIQGGEGCKSWQQLQGLLDQLHQEQPTVKGVVAMGGGASLDVVALAAHLYDRGLELIHVPTTLLAMVDASVGGKCAINWCKVKNKVGAYHFPSAIFTSHELLGANPDHPVIVLGLSEVYKHALLMSAPLRELYLDFLKTKHLAILQPMLEMAARVKEQVVALEMGPTPNPFQGVRHLLNLGHSVAHALEAVFNEGMELGPMSHGRAVAIGLVVESYLLAQESVHRQMAEELAPLIGPWPSMSESQWKDFFEAMKLDKKGAQEDIPLSKFGTIFDMIQPQSSYIAYCKREEIIHAWRECERQLASSLCD